MKAYKDQAYVASSPRAKGRRRRGQRGGQLAESGPALFVVLVVMFFPMIDLIYYGFAYGTAWYLHQLEARAVSVSLPPFGPNATFDGRFWIPELAAKEAAFLQTGFGKLLGLQDLLCQVQQLPDVANPTVVGNSVLTNAFHVQALVCMPIPYWINLPAFNGQGVVFTYSTTVLQEEKGLN